MAKRQFAAKTATSLFVSLLTVAGAVSTPAFAEDKDPGWYFSLSGGANSVDDLDSTLTSSSTGDPTEFGLLGLIAPSDIPVLGPPLIGGICDTIPMLCAPIGEGGGTSATSSSTITHKNGAAYGLSFGRAYKSGFRPEGGIFYRSNDIESVQFGQGNGVLTGTETENVSGKTTSVSVMGNLWFDFNRGGGFQPYIGAGIGMSRVGFDKYTIVDSLIADGEDTVFAYQAGAGVAFRVGDSTQLSLDLRYISADGGEVDGSVENSKLSLDYKATSAMLGLRYFLRENALVGDEDGDGVPDNLDKCPGTPLGVIVGADGCPADADGDGVADNIDKCPGTPAGVSVGPDGCPIDSDGDGVPDYLDKCPGTATGVQVGPNGCAIDADGDGVPDSLDKCPGSPAGMAVGPDGCPLDSDNDGVPDNLDKCPGTPAGAIVDANGCEPDGDGDGVPDRLDRCPDTPPGEKVGPTGCPNDSDGDGVPDDQDECPNTPAGAQVLANGCALKGDCRTPRPGEEVDENGCAIDQVFILRGVNFEFDSDRLTPEAKEILKQVAVTLKSYPDVNVEIAGHTDSTGTDAYNLGLSEKRSIAVKNFLSGQGVDAARMSPNGYGESQPIDTNETPEGQGKNRRVELRVIEEENAAVQQ